MAHVTGLICFNSASLKQESPGPWLIDLVLGVFCAPVASVVACALGIAGGKAALSQEVLTSKVCADERSCEEHSQKSWAHTSLRR